jgi:hypothetical protein
MAEVPRDGLANLEAVVLGTTAHGGKVPAVHPTGAPGSLEGFQGLGTAGEHDQPGGRAIQPVDQPDEGAAALGGRKEHAHPVVEGEFVRPRLGRLREFAGGLDSHQQPRVIEDHVNGIGGWCSRSAFGWRIEQVDHVGCLERPAENPGNALVAPHASIGDEGSDTAP